MIITVNSQSLFPTIPSSASDRSQIMEEIYHRSYSNRSRILPPINGEFQYVWAKYIFPQNMQLNLEGNSGGEVFPKLRNIDLNDYIMADQDPERSGKIGCCAVIAIFNLVLQIKNSFSQNGLFRKIDFIELHGNANTNPGFEVDRQNLLGAIGCDRYSDFNGYMIFSTHDLMIEHLMGMMRDNDRENFWNNIFRITDRYGLKVSVSDYNSRLSNLDALKCPTMKNFIVDEYGKRKNVGNQIDKSMIVEMIKNSNLTKKSLCMIERVLKNAEF